MLCDRPHSANVYCANPILDVHLMLMNNLQHKLLRLPQVKSSTGLSKSTIYARIAEGTFPKQIPLGPRLVVWVESDIQNWIAEQVSAARG
jgi:prophage regulatory protein